MPTSSPFVQFTVATVPSVKSALLNTTVPFVILLEKSQQLSENSHHQLMFRHNHSELTTNFRFKNY